MEIFKKIYLEYSPPIYSFLFKLCGDQAEAEELTQETFYRALKGFDKFRGDSSIFTWLAAIAKRTYYASLKAKKREVSCLDITEIVDSYFVEESMEDQVMRALVTQRVRTLLQELPAKYRDVVLFRIYADMSFAQIGETMNISENSAKVIYYRAKNMLKEKMQ